MDLEQELLDSKDYLNVDGDEACLIHDNKQLPKISGEYAGFKTTLHNISTLLYN